MSLQYQLNDEQLKELDLWLDNKNITLNNRGCRQLSDVVHMAQLFKNFDSKLVNMHFYTSHGKMELKLTNWENFNLKVLRKSGLKLTRTNLQELAKGDLNAIRGVLYHLMCKERYSLCAEHSKSPVSAVPCEKKSYNSYLQWLKKQKTAEETTKNETGEPDTQHLETQEQKLYIAMFKDYEEQKIMNLRKDEYIGSLHLKVNHLEEVIRTQDIRIKQLLEFLNKVTAKMLSMEDHLVADRSDAQPIIITEYDG